MDEPSIKRGTLAVLAGLAAGIIRWLVLFVLISLLLVAGIVVAVAVRKERALPLKPKLRLVPGISR